jgi:hypothetical protein
MYVICTEGEDIFHIHIRAKLISSLQNKSSIMSCRETALALVNI